ncbi:MAG: HdeA/HdeB family chaperone [Alphaproteobacteria bacterium]|nr:HdeA/HdeB family chaperone [Alphaproteobacteria bacterium]
MSVFKVKFSIAILLALGGMPSVALAQETAPKAPFFTETCEALFQKEDPAYLRPMTEMPLVFTFMLGFYTAKGQADGLELVEIANRNDIIPTLIEHCRAVPKDSYLTALDKTVPTPLETPLENPTPMLFDAHCGAVFGPPPKTFLRSPLEFSLVQHFIIGYYTAANVRLDPVDLANRRDLMVKLYDRCMENLDQPLRNAIAETVPAS